MSSFPISIPFVSFSCVISLTRASSIQKNRRRKEARLYLVPNFKGKAPRKSFSSSQFAELYHK